VGQAKDTIKLGRRLRFCETNRQKYLALEFSKGYLGSMVGKKNLHQRVILNCPRSTLVGPRKTRKSSWEKNKKEMMHDTFGLQLHGTQPFKKNSGESIKGGGNGRRGGEEGLSRKGLIRDENTIGGRKNEIRRKETAKKRVAVRVGKISRGSDVLASRRFCIKS